MDEVRHLRFCRIYSIRHSRHDFSAGFDTGNSSKARSLPVLFYDGVNEPVPKEEKRGIDGGSKRGYLGPLNGALDYERSKELSAKAHGYGEEG